ncbi:MAG: hypothetical protein IJQ39_14990, partial [Thermoguttaceae bacterium]|nr:hypothetical protein [Thermoguttaceae bacterium]
RGDGKENLSMFLFYVIRPWAEAHGYKGCVLSGRVSASHLTYLRKIVLRTFPLKKQYTYILLVFLFESAIINLSGYLYCHY